MCLDSQALPIEKAVRPFLVTLAYLLPVFDDFHHLGVILYLPPSGRRPVAYRVLLWCTGTPAIAC